LSGYANDAPVDDTSGVGKVLPQATVPGWMGFGSGTRPKPALCKEWSAWSRLLAAATRVPKPPPKTFTYDLVDVGREVLSQLTIPLSRNFSSALGLHAATENASLSVARIKATGALYVQVLRDLDTLLATDAAFMLGPWLASARKLGGDATDCTDTVLGDKLSRCDDFMEWNARAQLTTWHPTDSPTNPTPPTEGTAPSSWPGRINDYARKQWSGLVGGYYAVRVEQYLEQGLADARAGRPFDSSAVARREAKLAFDWQTDFENIGPTQPVGDPVAVSSALRAKYSGFFAGCAGE